MIAAPARFARGVTARLEGFGTLDRPAGAVQRAARAVARRLPRTNDLLTGGPLGHPLHPPLTDVVIGAWTSALFLDVCGGRESRAAADRLLALGIAASVPTAAAGVADWAELEGGERRVGTVHALGNAVALAGQCASLLARRRGERRRGLGLSLASLGAATAAAWVGGELAFGNVGDEPEG